MLSSRHIQHCLCRNLLTQNGHKLQLSSLSLLTQSYRHDGGHTGRGALSCSLSKQNHETLTIQQVQHFSLNHSNGPCKQKLKPKENTRQVVESEDKSFGQLSTSQKVARAGKDATYTGIVLVGIGVTGLMFYAIGRELLSGQSPSGIFGKALKLCRRNEELTCAIGEPIKGYGETNRRGRRRYVSHAEYERDGVKFMRMKFYVEGPNGKGTAHLEVKQDESNKYGFRYLFVELEDLLRRTIVIEDNR